MELFENFFEDPDKFIYEDEKQKFIEHMDFLKTMSVQESTLYKKWKEFNHNDYEIRQKALNSGEKEYKTYEKVYFGKKKFEKKNK